MKSVRLATAALVLAAAGYAQEFRATISGAVTDATGAVVSSAKVIATETQTGTRVQAASDSAGHYTIPFLLPGDYDLTIQFSGFKAFVRKGIHLGAGEQPVIDARLEVGDTKVAVEVVADVPLVNAENASVGQAITTKEVEDLPSNGGTPMMLASLAMGVIATGQPSTVQPYASGGAAGWSIGGMPNQTNELMVDGVPNTTWDGRLAYSPPQDAVSEVRVKAFDTDAAYGHTGGGTANTILKSGTNVLHGSLYEKNQPSNMVANTFFNNKAGQPPTITHFNQFGGTASGPIYLPKLYDGRNRVFWFFAFEGLQDSTPNTNFLTVPTLPERGGDFSQLLALKAPLSPVTIYDPSTAVLNGSTVTRTAFPGNVVPTNRLNPIALKYLQYFPAPIVTSLTRDDGYQNFANTSNTVDGFTNEFGRLDVNWSDRTRTYLNVRHTDYFQTKNDYFKNISTGSDLSRSNEGASLDQVITLTPSNLLDIRANFTRMYEDHSAPSAGFNPSSIGFPDYLSANAQYLQMPYITFASNSYNPLGFNSANQLPSQSEQIYGTWVSLRGKHQIKSGADFRLYKLNYLNYGNATGNVAFTANTWTRSASNASSTVGMGQDFASFLLGLPTGGQFDINTSAMLYQYYSAVFVQDDWRISHSLTVNLGVRFDHDFSYHEKWGRVVNGFAYDTPSPLAAAAQAAYAAKEPASMLALLPASAFKVNGGLTFASPRDNAIFHNTSHLFAPRAGLAWTPDSMHGKTVIRAGFAMFVTPIAISTLQISGAYSTNAILNQQGFSQSTSLTPSNDNYLTPYATLGNPFPGGAILKPAGSSAGLLTFAGQTVSYFNPNMQNPYSLRWNFGVQRELTPNTMLEIAYVGNHSLHLPVTYTQQNLLPRQYLSTLSVRDQALITGLTATVPNPFLGLQTNNGTASTVATSLLLSRFPEFPAGTGTGSAGVIAQDLNLGSSYYESFSVRVQKRVSRGLSITANYMRSRMIDQTTWLNDTDPAPEHRLSPFDHPNRIATAVVYELPFGRGRMFNFAAPLANKILAGWRLTGTYTFQVGAPITFVNGSTTTPGDYVYFGGKLNINNRLTDGTAFNTSVFDLKSADAFQYHIRTFSTTFGDVRQDGINDWNMALLKEFSFRERARFRLQCDFFNVINHPTFSAPNVQASNSAFGTITSQANRSRMLQVSAKLSF
jgi:hypothetical protein